MEAQNFSVLLKELREKQVAGTRTWVIDLVRAWLDDPRGARLFGVTGDAGMGKSAPRRRGDRAVAPPRRPSQASSPPRCCASSARAAARGTFRTSAAPRSARTAATTAP